MSGAHAGCWRALLASRRKESAGGRRACAVRQPQGAWRMRRAERGGQRFPPFPLRVCEADGAQGGNKLLINNSLVNYPC